MPGPGKVIVSGLDRIKRLTIRPIQRGHLRLRNCHSVHPRIVIQGSSAALRIRSTTIYAASNPLLLRSQRTLDYCDGLLTTYSERTPWIRRIGK
jgi:hypothetical protein